MAKNLMILALLLVCFSGGFKCGEKHAIEEC